MKFDGTTTGSAAMTILKEMKILALIPLALLTASMEVSDPSIGTRM